MLKVSALTWPKLVDWYRAQYARFRSVLKQQSNLWLLSYNLSWNLIPCCTSAGWFIRCAHA